MLQAAGLGQDTLGSGVVFRFRPGSPSLSSTYVATNVEIGPFLDPREIVARGPSGWGLSPPWSAEFLGAASTLRSEGIESSSQPLGPVLTIEVWFRAGDVDGVSSLLTNQAPAANGFTLGLEDGVPFFELAADAGTFRVAASSPVAAEEDHWLAVVVRYEGSGTLRLNMYDNGQLLAATSDIAAFASPYVLEAPFYVGTRTEGDSLSPSLVGAFTGHVYTAIVRDYAAHPAYLASRVPFDGSEYFGLPAYHDYSLDSFNLPMDQRIAAEPVEVRHRFFLPYANDEFIPQGTATRVETGGTGDVQLVYVSYYHRTREGALATQRSIVVEIEAATGRVRRTFRLRGRLEYSHAGGVAYARGAVFISSLNFLERYPLPAYEGPFGPKYIDLAPDPSGSISVLSKASFVSAFDDTLWVGDWRPSNDVAPFLYAHPLDQDGRPESTASHVFALPRNVQGVDLFRHRGQTYVFLSRNRNSREAEVLRYRREILDPNSVVAPDTAVTMPFGIEDLSFFEDGTLWTNSESGTVYYQRRDTNPWRVFYPFVYSVPAHVVLPGTSTAIEYDHPESFLKIESFPNPLRDSAHIIVALPRPQIARVYIADILGRTTAILADGHIGAGTKKMTWDAQGSASGIYFAIVEGESGRVTHPIIVVK